MMEIAIIVVGSLGIILIMALVAMLFGAVTAKCFERACEKLIIAARNEERLKIAQHYNTSSWWFSEYPDVQHALALVTEDIVTGMGSSSVLREKWKDATGRNL